MVNPLRRGKNNTQEAGTGSVCGRNIVEKTNEDGGASRNIRPSTDMLPKSRVMARRHACAISMNTAQQIV